MTGRTRRGTAEESEAFLATAKEFMAASQTCVQRGWWRAAALNSIHAAISAADAVCILKLEERAAGEQHREAADLLASSGAPDARGKAGQLSAILDMKDRVAYESRPLNRGECEATIKRAKRILEWAEALIER